jgi:outer membrane protein OmpA-like peptidoglycan-associated protein
MAVMSRSILSGSALALLAACATSAPSAELVDARRAYVDAERSKASELVPAEVVVARRALERAESAHIAEPGSFRERNLAYLAHREALAAVAKGEIADARRAIARAELRYRALAESMQRRAREQLERARRELARTSQQLSSVRLQLDDQGQALDQRTLRLLEQERLLARRKAELEARTRELETEREARRRAEAQAEAALASLQEIASVHDEQRGTVISLSGGLLFASGRAELLPIARRKLAAVADALKLAPEERAILVEGHTDARGSEQANLRLSRARAGAVRSLLVSRGVAPSRIRIVGRGESVPIADNESPEGRAANRRVEIVIEPPASAP